MALRIVLFQIDPTLIILLNLTILFNVKSINIAQ